MPITALVNDRGMEQVIKVVDNRPVPTPVKTGPSNGFMVVIEDGLAPGDEILINTYQFSGTNPVWAAQPPMRAGIRNGR